MSATQDRPGLIMDSFSASLIETPGLPHTLTVTGKVSGDYRVGDVHLVPRRHQPSKTILVLDVTAEIGPIENPHPEFIKVIDVEYTHKAAHTYTEVTIESGSQRLTVKVIDAL
jgi:hypothetical protein